MGGIRRLAILGGTFDPVHYGHLRVAEEVRESMGFDRVVFMPASVAPHKAPEDSAPADMRLEMLGLATADNPGFDVSDMEVRRGGRSFTIDTLRELGAAEGGGGTDVSLILGNDAFNDITTWCEYERLFDLASFVVVARARHGAKKPAEALPVELAQEFWYDAGTESYLNSYGRSITYLATTIIDVSSTEIRRRVAAGGSIRYLVPGCVAGYIASHGLYAAEGGAEA